MPDFQKDLCEMMRSTLDRYHVEYKEKDQLHDLAIRLYTFWGKYIPPCERDVLMSKELMESLDSFPKSVQIALDKLTEWVKSGVDINCFQGRGLYGKGNHDYQNMLYGVVHLHLSAKKDDVNPVIKKNGFAKPGKYLIYAYFSDTTAYFIKVLEHPKAFDKDKDVAVEWISKEIFAIIAHNWPELFAKKKIKDAFLCDGEGNPIDIDDETIAVLSTNRINALINLGTDLYMPGSGITASGDSLFAVLQANCMVKDARWVQIEFEKNKESIHKGLKSVLRKCGRPAPAAFDIHYEYFEPLSRFLLVDRMSGAFYDYHTRRFGILRE